MSDQDLTERLISTFLDAAIRQGHIKTKGKTQAQLHEDFLHYMKKIVLGPNAEFQMVVDHRVTILKEARRFNQNEDFSLSCLLYATWFEHWLNGLIDSLARRKRMSQEIIVQMIRDTPFRGKLTWLLLLFGLPAINPSHKTRILQIMDMRNSFVHFKFNYLHVDHHDEKVNDKIRQAIENVEKTISYLRRYEQRRLSSVGEKRIRRIMNTSQIKSGTPKG